MTNSELKYNKVAITLHWVMAIAFIGMLASGLIMDSNLLSKAVKFKTYQLHKSFGLLLLVAFVFRLYWRLGHRPPAMPEYISNRDQKLAKLGHWALYLLMLIMPLSGWAMVSASPLGLPTIFFDWFEWPSLPGIERGKELRGKLGEAHELIAYGLMALISIHALAALKHSFIDKTPLLKRMWFK